MNGSKVNPQDYCDFIRLTFPKLSHFNAGFTVRLYLTEGTVPSVHGQTANKENLNH